MRMTLDKIKQYIKDNYDLNFELLVELPSSYEKYQDLVYRIGKKEYTLSVGYAHHPEVGEGEYWSIYYDFMDRKEWHGSGGTEIDEGTGTIDKIMQEWGFKKQMTIFDFIKEEE